MTKKKPMTAISWAGRIVPFPPHFWYREKLMIGVYLCGCGEAGTVRFDKRGKAQFFCDNHLTVRGCGTGGGYLLRADLPEPSLETFEAFDLSSLPREHRDLLLDAWAPFENFDNSETLDNSENPETFKENRHVQEIEAGAGDGTGDETGDAGEPEQSEQTRRKSFLHF